MAKVKVVWVYEYEINAELYPEEIRQDSEKIAEFDEKNTDFSEFMFDGKGETTVSISSE